MKTSLDYRKDFLCVVSEFEVPDGRHSHTVVKEWYPVHPAEEAAVRALLGRPVAETDSKEAIYVDEEGAVFQLLNKGETKPIEVERLPEAEQTELEVQLEASLNGQKTHERNGDSKRMQRKYRTNGREQQVLKVANAAPQSLTAESSSETKPGPQASGEAVNGAPPEAPLQLNLRQKLAEVRRRIGYVQKRGHNERFNYSYVTAADIAGAVGDLLSQLGVVVVPSLESISYEPMRNGGGQVERMARVIMTYTFTDVDTAEAVTVKVPGEGLDVGDKAPYKAMTGALKYALLQSFLLATGDDPEDERPDARFSTPGSDRPINAEQVCELEKLIDDTGTDLERVLAYYKVASLGEMTESAYRRALELLNRKLAKRDSRETVHAQD